jgi:hypothetical protein
MEQLGFSVFQIIRRHGLSASAPAIILRRVSCLRRFT